MQPCFDDCRLFPAGATIALRAYRGTKFGKALRGSTVNSVAGPCPSGGSWGRAPNHPSIHPSTNHACNQPAGRRTALSPAVSECRSVKRCQGGVGAVSGRCQLTLVSWQCQAIFTVLSPLSAHAWLNAWPVSMVSMVLSMVSRQGANEKGPRGQFGPRSAPGVM